MTIEPSSRIKGFSLVELLTVMAVIAVTAAIAIPMGLNYVRHFEVQGAGQNIASQMQLTRAQAVKRNARRGIVLNFNYPNPGEYQFTTLDEDPVNGGYDGQVFLDPLGDFDPGNRDYGTAPTPGNSTIYPPGGGPKPHGQVIPLPADVEFIGSQAYSSLLFQVDGSVEAVTVDNVSSGNVVAQNGLDWEIRILHPKYGLTRTIRISRNGRVIVENP